MRHQGVSLFYPVADRRQPQAVSGFVMAAMSLEEIIVPRLQAHQYLNFPSGRLITVPK